jgi:hypothetical protein
VNQVRQAAAQVRGALVEAHRREWAFLLAATVRLAGDLDLAEACIQECVRRCPYHLGRSGRMPRSLPPG